MMKCTMCGSQFKSARTDLPFKVSDTTIAILKSLPVLQCGNCPGYLIEDKVFERVERMLAEVDSAAELEVIRYAA